MPRDVYLDYNATTPLHPKVRDEMVRVFESELGNPSSPHRWGRRARDLIDAARESLSSYLGVSPSELFFTSGGTESNNLATSIGRTDRVPYSCASVEHASLLEPLRKRWADGLPGETLPVGPAGLVDPAALNALPEGSLVSIQWVNNETGVIQDLPALSEAAHARGVLLHTDGAQGFFRIKQDIPELGVDLATITAHKSFGPLGVGALYARRGTLLEALFRGGPQERSVRPGTENLASVHGLGVLADLAKSEDLWPHERLESRRAAFLHELQDLDGLRLNPPERESSNVRGAPCFPGTISLSFDDLHAETLLVLLDREGVGASSGSACASGEERPSHVLRAMGVEDRRVRGTLRFSFGPSVPEEDLCYAARALGRVVTKLRARQT